MVRLESGQLLIEFLSGIVDGRNIHRAQPGDELLDEEPGEPGCLPEAGAKAQNCKTEVKAFSDIRVGDNTPGTSLERRFITSADEWLSSLVTAPIGRVFRFSGRLRKPSTSSRARRPRHSGSFREPLDRAQPTSSLMVLAISFRLCPERVAATSRISAISLAANCRPLEAILLLSPVLPPHAPFQKYGSNRRRKCPAPIKDGNQPRKQRSISPE
jgi:hypothetical protein